MTPTLQGARNVGEHVGCVYGVTDGKGVKDFTQPEEWFVGDRVGVG